MTINMNHQFEMEPLSGIEPDTEANRVTVGLISAQSTPLMEYWGIEPLTISGKLEPVERIELSSSVYETVVIPLY